MATSNITTLPVNPKGKPSYEIYIGENLLHTPSTWIRNDHTYQTAVIFTHPHLIETYATPLATALKSIYQHTHILTIPDGESSKSLTQVEVLVGQLLTLKIERNDTLFALGGGVIGDLVGFVASVYLRGVPFYQVPTSLLAQVDASIGGKTGVNHSMGKNLIGAFYQPQAVIIDTETLNTLPPREWRCGLAEIIKYGIIDVPEIFELLTLHTDTLSKLTLENARPLWRKLIELSAGSKAQIVSADETEKGRREILNFGHTIAHAIESIFDYGTYKHGEAVAFGMIGAGRLAVSHHLWPQALQDQLEAIITNLGFSTKFTPCETANLIEKMYLDKKVRKGQLRFILPTGIGSVTTINTITDKELEHILIPLME